MQSCIRHVCCGNTLSMPYKMKEDDKIKYVYFDYGGSHSSVLASFIHIGRLGGRSPSKQELMQLPYFDKTTPDDFAKMHPAGNDDKGNEVFFLGTKSSNFEPTINNLAELMGVAGEFCFVSTMNYVNPILRLGGWMSRGLSQPWLGRWLVIRGAKSAYPSLVKLVEKTKVKSIQGGT